MKCLHPVALLMYIAVVSWTVVFLESGLNSDFEGTEDRGGPATVSLHPRHGCLRLNFQIFHIFSNWLSSGQKRHICLINHYFLLFYHNESILQINLDKFRITLIESPPVSYTIPLPTHAILFYKILILSQGTIQYVKRHRTCHRIEQLLFVLNCRLSSFALLYTLYNIQELR